MKRAIRLKVNGRPVSLDTEDDRTLLWVLRTDLALTGTKYGCGAGVCGSCTVVANGKAIRSCQATLKEVEGQAITTIEGLAKGGELTPLQRAFVEHGGFQCGYCTSGMIMNAHALLQHSPHVSPQAILDGMENNPSAAAVRICGSLRPSSTSRTLARFTRLQHGTLRR